MEYRPSTDRTAGLHHIVVCHIRRGSKLIERCEDMWRAWVVYPHYRHSYRSMMCEFKSGFWFKSRFKAFWAGFGFKIGIKTKDGQWGRGGKKRFRLVGFGFVFKGGFGFKIPQFARHSYRCIGSNNSKIQKDGDLLKIYYKTSNKHQ